MMPFWGKWAGSQASIYFFSVGVLKMYPEGEINYRIQTVNEEDLLVNEEDNPDYSPV